ncbi:anthrone oxygenase family protein [Actinophytocola sediminis]
MDAVRLVALVLATISSGLIAGLFYGYHVAVTTALRGVDARAFVTFNQQVNKHILNGGFFLPYLGSAVFSALAAVFLFGGDRGSVLLPTVLAFGFNVVAILVTGGGNIPINNAIDRSNLNDATATRERYEQRWNRFNAIRSLLHSLGFLSLCWALIAYGAL